jgi:hypothetical protein
MGLDRLLCSIACLSPTRKKRKRQARAIAIPKRRKKEKKALTST